MAALPVQVSEQGLVYIQYAEEDRKIRTERSAADYQGYDSQIKHIYALPDTYIGSMTPTQRQEFLFDAKEMKLKPFTVNAPEGYLRGFLEVLSNAGDNADASRRMGVDPGSISVNLDKQWTVVRSEGEPIPVEVRPELCTREKCRTVIDFIFGQLLTSSNYDKRVISMGCGKNGFGAKLCNIFSKEFRVKVGDPKRGQEHESIWRGNMIYHVSSTTKPGFAFNEAEGKWVSIANQENAYRGPAYVEVSWLQDFHRFGYEQHPPEVAGFFSRYLIEFGFTCKIGVNLCGQRFDVRSIRDFARLCWSKEECDTAITHYEWENGMPEAMKKLHGVGLDKAVAEGKTAEAIPIVEIIVMDTPDAAHNLSYVNGLMTSDGGVHVQEAQRVFIAGILDIVNARFGEKKAAKKKGKGGGAAKGKDEKKEVKIHLTPGDVKPHLSMIVNCRLPDPAYNSQSKTYLNRPKPKIKLDEAELKGIANWKLIDRLIATLEMKLSSRLSKTDGRKKKHVLLEKGEDANEAGGPNSEKCILILCEGNSAILYARKRRDFSGGKDFIATLPLRGKVLNVTDRDKLKIGENKEIIALKQMIGLTTDGNYFNPEMKATLRYGFILGILDADSDGEHIKSLLINLLYRQWPSLIQLGMFGFLQTPAVRLFDKDGKIVGRFPTQEQFNRWEEKNPGHGLKVVYYKGMGSSRDSDIQDDLSTSPTIICVYDDQTPAALDLAFRKNQADARKMWIQRMRDFTDDITSIPISGLIHQRSITDVINRDLHRYTIDALFRAIPCYRDGLKKSQRQALYFALESWNYGKKKGAEENINRLANQAASAIHYHHGSDSLANTITRMTHRFVGSHNLPLFQAGGQTGTRDEGGADAAHPRYTSTGLEWWVKHAIFRDLVELIPLTKVEGHSCEPQWIPCIIPLHVVNGACGISTGWSSYIACHHPYDVIRWLLERCAIGDSKSGMPKPFQPHYRGFVGELKIKEYKAPAPPSIPIPVPGAAPVVPEASLHQSVDPDDDSDIEAENPEGDEEKEEEKEAANDELIQVSRRTRRKVGAKTLQTFGKFQVLKAANGKYDVRITELPIGRWILPYRKWIESLLAEKKIKDFSDNSTTEIPNFTMKGLTLDVAPNHQNLRLKKSYGLSNATLIDEKGNPYHFADVTQIMESFYQSLIGVFTQLITNRIKQAEQDLIDLAYKKKFISLVISQSENPDERIFVIRRKKAEIYEQMDKFGIPHKFGQKALIFNLTEDDILECDREMIAKQVEIVKHKSTKPQEIWAERLHKLNEVLQKHKYT